MYTTRDIQTAVMGGRQPVPVQDTRPRPKASGRGRRGSLPLAALLNVHEPLVQHALAGPQRAVVHAGRHSGEVHHALVLARIEFHALVRPDLPPRDVIETDAD